MTLKKTLRKLAGKMIPSPIRKMLHKPHLTDPTFPAVFNSEGEQMKFCYLMAPGGAHHPYSLTDGRQPRRIVWDRFNFGLETHLYTSDAIFALHKNGGGTSDYSWRAKKSSQKFTNGCGSIPTTSVSS